MKHIAPAVREETMRVAAGTAVMTVIMWIVFFAAHLVWPDKIPFNAGVILGGIGGLAVAVLNFFLMGLTVQQVVDTNNEESARQKMRASQAQRKLMQAVWIILAIVVPFLNAGVCLSALFFPGFEIRMRPVLAAVFPFLGRNKNRE